MKKYKFTIFTPVYNGAKFVHKVFESVRNSTYSNFEWIIVNDGSNDNSKEVIEQLISTMDCDITFVNFEKNRGKHRAWNHAASIATGDLWLPIDCDDSFRPESLAFFNEKWNEIGADDIYGIDVLCYRDSIDNIIGDKFPYDGFRSSYLEYTHRYKILKEKWGCVRMDLIKAVPFPDIDSTFYTGPYLWNTFSKEYYVMCYNTPLRHYYYEPTSIINGNTYNYYIIKMRIHYNNWFLKQFSSYLLKYDRVTLVKRYITYPKNIVFASIMKVLKIKKIERVKKW